MSVAGGELDKVICWLTGPDGDSLEFALAEGAEFRHFLAAPPGAEPGT
ncbi:MAG: DUF2200 family protein [Tabrizicola sp.]|nr:DUF2200 family protein [Tabrizicola sp.]MDZ4088014.1 DUF2200 family protein [Tabrizicola sp.]